MHVVRRVSAIAAIAIAVSVCHPMSYAQEPESQSRQTIHGDNGVTLPPPPVAPVHVVTDDYHGIRVEDPYRWLEEAKSPETRAWINEENAYTEKYLSQVKNLPQIASELKTLMRVERYSIPV